MLGVAWQLVPYNWLGNRPLYITRTPKNTTYYNSAKHINQTHCLPAHYTMSHHPEPPPSSPFRRKKGHRPAADNYKFLKSTYSVILHHSAYELHSNNITNITSSLSISFLPHFLSPFTRQIMSFNGKTHSPDKPPSNSPHRLRTLHLS